MKAQHPTLLQVSRTHAVTILRDSESSAGLLFDSASPEPLPLTRSNLERCIGASYDDAVTCRGYAFATQRKRKAKASPSDVKRSRH